MENHNPYIPELDLILRPAFYVVDGKISQINQAAKTYLLNVGDEVLPLLSTGSEEYKTLQEGCLYLTLSIGEQKLEATIIAAEGRQLFLLEQQTALAELRALSLAARELRNPLTGMLSTASQLLPQGADSEQMAQFNRRLHQIMRIVSNMSDAVYYCEATSTRMEYVQVCAFLEELLSKSKDQLATANIRLDYTLPNTAIYTLADTEKLERAIYNLISNAAKHTAPGGSFTVSLTQKNRLYLSVTDSGFGSDSSFYANAYSRYLRTPSIADGPEGIGLGMVLVRATASIHNGTVLIDRPDGQGTRVTMTMEIRHDKQPLVRSPLFYPDYAGERDHALQELADVLPANLYQQ